MVKGVIFDLDGTLIDTIEGLANSTNFALEQYGFPTHSVEKYRSFVGNGVGKLVERALPDGKKNMKTEVRAVFEKNYAETMLSSMPVYDGIEELIKYLREKNIKLAVNTNKLDIFAKPMIKAVFGDVFETVLGETNEFPRKPEPDAVNFIIEKMGIKKEECIFVGDSQVDIETAKNAGIFGIAVTWGFVKKDVLVSFTPDKIVDTADEIKEFINERNR